jgi:hypothetical protein
MSRVFLYIDESKDYKNHTLYIGGLISHLSLTKIEAHCQRLCTSRSNEELKSTKPYDREFFRGILKATDIPFRMYATSISASSDKEYLSALTLFLEMLFRDHDFSGITSI